MKNKKVVIPVVIVIVAAILALALAIGSVVVKKHNAAKRNEDVDLSGMINHDVDDAALQNVYSCDLTIYGEGNSGLYVLFENESNLWAIVVGEECAATGVVEIDGNEILTYATDESGNKIEDNCIKYILDGDYLLLETGFTKGEIPEGEYFNATISKVDSTNMEIRYVFKDDGTYKAYEIKEGQSLKEATTMDGTYKREGNLINRTLSGNEMIPFYIYNNSVVASYYVADDSEAALELYNQAVENTAAAAE